MRSTLSSTLILACLISLWPLAAQSIPLPAAAARINDSAEDQVHADDFDQVLNYIRTVHTTNDSLNNLLNSSSSSQSSGPSGLSAGPNPFTSVMGFLRKFGYLEQGLPNSESLYREEALIKAVQSMQLFGGLNPTGQLDNDTIKLMSTPRCGNKDVVDAEGDGGRKKRFVIGGSGWNKRKITYFLANWTPKIDSEDIILRELRKAFKTWSDYAHLQFVQVFSNDADIIILFGSGYHGDNYPFDGVGFTLAHAYFPNEFGHFGGDVHFDEDEPWTTVLDTENPGIDFYTVATHELGHSLGLAHSPVIGSIMFPYYKGYQPNLNLDYDDILAMYQLYIARSVDDNRDPEANSTTTSTASPTTSPTASPTWTQSTWPTSSPTSPLSTSSSVSPTTPSTRSVTKSLAPKLPIATVRPTVRAAGTTTTSYFEEDDDDEEEEGDGNKRGVDVTTDRVTINYEGDYESVDEHRRRLNKTKTVEHNPLPDICQGNFDAISVLRNELFVFKDQYVWRLNQRSIVEYGYPTHMRNLFRELPYDLKNVDAVFEDADGHILFFSGAYYWISNGDRMIGERIPLAYLGLPAELERIDAALMWGKNKKIYLFSKNLFWRYDQKKGQMDAGYPRDISKWRGVPANLDAAMTWTDGRTYFFKDNSFWQFDDALIKTMDGYPFKASQHWLGCP